MNVSMFYSRTRTFGLNGLFQKVTARLLVNRYDQTEHEWVIVLQGLGVIEYENGRQITLNVGDYVYLPAHLKHRVLSTAEHEQTIWLAIFWS